MQSLVDQSYGYGISTVLFFCSGKATGLASLSSLRSVLRCAQDDKAGAGGKGKPIGLFSCSGKATGSFAGAQDDRAGAGGEGKKGSGSAAPFFLFPLSSINHLSS